MGTDGEAARGAAVSAMDYAAAARLWEENLLRLLIEARIPPVEILGAGAPEYVDFSALEAIADKAAADTAASEAALHEECRKLGIDPAQLEDVPPPVAEVPDDLVAHYERETSRAEEKLRQALRDMGVDPAEALRVEPPPPPPTVSIDDLAASLAAQTAAKEAELARALDDLGIDPKRMADLPPMPATADPDAMARWFESLAAKLTD